MICFRTEAPRSTEPSHRDSARFWPAFELGGVPYWTWYHWSRGRIVQADLELLPGYLADLGLQNSPLATDVLRAANNCIAKYLQADVEHDKDDPIINLGRLSRRLSRSLPPVTRRWFDFGHTFGLMLYYQRPCTYNSGLVQATLRAARRAGLPEQYIPRFSTLQPDGTWEHLAPFEVFTKLYELANDSSQYLERLYEAATR